MSPGLHSTTETTSPIGILSALSASKKPASGAPPSKQKRP
eukprot:CAMPEP_0195041032 /NCGR_PEP_ID=MMETSP0326_2-20130528/80650_1 /TAXON_ID=2866 ORGANISM="Crypthecodinium cohnii, Strain Seligo" /NCGR_SAMPLE_ID=MMETSP0326_2 /ASSEMBLY_ACC=CAM_ASM_000348 /LENGTH=39 /DNA_ID= /DNA_START= /DNA_END= /DNA_ORIENTATION=